MLLLKGLKGLCSKLEFHDFVLIIYRDYKGLKAPDKILLGIIKESE